MNIAKNPITIVMMLTNCENKSGNGKSKMTLKKNDPNPVFTIIQVTNNNVTQYAL